MMKTFGSVLDETKGIGPGFDFCRLFLAFSVLGWHSLLVLPGSYGKVFETPWWIVNFSILPMFFALSGFLVAGSAQRLSLKNFFLNRGLRIFPALIVEILLSAFVLGVVFTTFSLHDYFTDRIFYKYLLNLVGKINYALPGVFLDNSFPGIVNASLWTVPFEILCYLVLGLLMFAGLMRRTGLVFVLAVATMFLGVAITALHDAVPQSAVISSIWNVYTGSAKGPLLLPCFLMGVLAHSWRHRIPFDWRILVACLLCLLALGVFGKSSFWGDYLAACAPLMVYVVCYVGLLKIPRIPFFHRGDYSYGIYLYAFPIQQSLVAVFPGLTSLWLHMLISAVLVTLFAVFSWHVIEKPILAQRKKFSFTARLHGVDTGLAPAAARDPAPRVST